MSIKEQKIWQNQSQKQSNHSSQSQGTQSKPVITCSWRIARENMCLRVTIGLGFTPDWMKKWCEFFKPSQSYSSKSKTDQFSTLAWKSIYQDDFVIFSVVTVLELGLSSFHRERNTPRTLR